MTISDDELLDFETDLLADWDDARARRLLVEQPDVYRNHLIVARFIDEWVEELMDEPVISSVDFHSGYIEGVRELAAHLRQGDFVVGGMLHDHIARGDEDDEEE